MGHGVFDVAAVRAAEERLMAQTSPGALMQRAATGLESVIAGVLEELRGGVAGSAVAILVGSGNNGGDALWAGAGLAARGARVVALTLSSRWHEEGAEALVARGGSVRASGSLTDEAVAALLADADVIIDGILGIGGRGELRDRAAQCASWASMSGAPVIAVDVPSGVDADSGAVENEQACMEADLTVTFGCLKPGLLLAPGRFFVGGWRLIDIGLGPQLPEANIEVLDDLDLAACVPEPADADYKYSRGVVGIAAGSRSYRGAGYLATGAARVSGVGMVRYLQRDDSLAESIVNTFWDVVISDKVEDPKITGYAIGPGWGTDEASAETLRDVFDLDVPVVVDADGLRLLAAEPMREWLIDRGERGRVTVLTPHEGEFAALGYAIDGDRLSAARRAATELGCVVLLKGPGTVVAAPDGEAFIDTYATAVLGTAGSGDVLTGLMAGMLAAARARTGSLSLNYAARIAAAAAGLHGIAGDIAGRAGRPVTAHDILEALPDAIGQVRRR